MSFSIRLAEMADEDAGIPPADRLHRLFGAWWSHTMEDDPEQASAQGWPGHGHRWTDRSEAAVARRLQEAADTVAALDTVAAADPRGPGALGPEDSLSLAVLRRRLTGVVEGGRFPGHLLPVSKMTGPHLEVPRTLSIMPARTLGDLEDVLARLHGVGTVVDQTITLLEAGLGAGLSAPRVGVADIPSQVRALTGPPTASSPLLATMAVRPPLVDPEDFAAVRAEAEEAVAGAAVPALERFGRYLETTYLPASRESVAWSDLPDGPAWYAYLARRSTTTDLEPGDIHALGLEECNRIRGEMEVAMAEAGHRGSFEEFTALLRDDPRFYLDGPDELLARYRDIAKRVDPGLPGLFATLPRLTYGVRAVPDHEAPATTTAYYQPGSPAAGRPGWFCANTWDLASRPTWEMEALTLHEAVPGHHLQIALAAEIPGLPAFRALAEEPTAYVEGWALYAEGLGADLGLYRDPFSRFGQLSYEMWRAVRLVVDTGLHTLGWTRDQAVEFFRARSGKPLHDIAVEVDRYISWPAQALAYKMGELAITRLRAEAAGALGAGFDVRRFHDVVLGAGPLPLDLLEERVRAWTAAGGPAAPAAG